jgi:hypothetical protein
MEAHQPIVAIVGSARSEIVGNQEPAAHSACQELGRELAKAGWHIAVYASDPDFIEADVVSGYLAAGTAGEGSIVCSHPQGAAVKFAEAELPEHHKCFRGRLSGSPDWEVSFYHSLAEVDGILLLGGGTSTLIAGHVALSRGLPIIAIAPFGGEARKIWQHLASHPALVQEADVQAMAAWTSRTAQACVESLVAQYGRLTAKKAAEERALQEMQAKASKWDEHAKEERDRSTSVRVAGGFLVLFIALLIAGLVATSPGWAYTLIAVFGLCAAGGMGATIRMLSPSAPSSRQWEAPLLGVAVGLVFSLLYLIPQLIGDSGFLIPQTAISGAARVQYISALIVAFLAGFGFDVAVEQLLSRARERGREIAQGSP